MEVDFGDTELFEQFGEETPANVNKHIRFSDEDEHQNHDSELRDRLEESEETVVRLKTENEELRRKLNFLSRPPGINVVDPNIDSPLCQILFGNNSISKQCRRDIEDYVFDLIQKHQHQQHENQASAQLPGPQNSSFILEENQNTNSKESKKIRDAFCVVGSVLYFTSFCLDKLGQPLLNENPQLTEGWEIPKYQQVFAQVMALEGQEVQIKEKRPKPCCFNCGEEGHQLRDCPKPKDMARINEKRKEFAQGNNQGNNQRYHAEEVEERFAKYKPGILGQELLDALGVVANALPPFIYRMRELGYPPGWLKEAETENSGLTLYDGKTPGEEESNGPGQDVSYDVSKLVDFPGFNVSAPPNVRDEYRSFGSIPMQPHHWKPTFAEHLLNTYQSPMPKCAKRSHEAESSPIQTKKRQSNLNVSGCSDMDTDSDQETPGRNRRDSFKFQPPLPPGSPHIGTPPPLPPGTPPVTPTPPPLPKGTPPPTPPTNSGSPALARGSVGGEESEDGLTLEELEEQQRLLWAALENADNGTSDSDTGATGTPAVASPAVDSPGTASPNVPQSVEMEEDDAHVKEAVIASTSASPARTPQTVEDGGTESSDDLIVLDEVSQGADSGSEKNGTVEVGEGKDAAATDPRPGEDEEEPTAKKITAVPHRSRFAEGIIPFEETPEFTEVAEATGVYFRIRGLLKESPRNQAKTKKQSS
ncbi:zinc finger CCHC domain-containing protein 8 [Trichomycterus rosablanca]|uniref:zinc finger CCHC domain-containing protein 8 n=1 Tax=Trichomycterus rosablanca TaxID=2290929 RepID=UPI002F357429